MVSLYKTIVMKYCGSTRCQFFENKDDCKPVHKIGENNLFLLILPSIWICCKIFKNIFTFWLLIVSEAVFKCNIHSFLQSWNRPPFYEGPPPFLGTPSLWNKFKKLPLFFWESSKLVHINCIKHFKMKVLRFALY